MIKKKIISKTIIVILLFSIFTSLNNITFEKKTFGELAIPSLEIINGKQQQQQQQQQNTSIFSSGNFSFKNIRLSHDLTVKINQGKPPKTDNFNITKGYKIEPVLWNLTLPSSVTFDDKGNIYIAEAGYAPGGLETTPRILKINTNDEVSSFVDRDLYGPITNIVYHDGKLYVSNRAKISTIDIQSGVVKDIIVGLPSLRL